MKSNLLANPGNSQTSVGLISPLTTSRIQSRHSFVSPIALANADVAVAPTRRRTALDANGLQTAA